MLLCVGVGYYLGTAWDDSLSLLVNGGMVLAALALLIAAVQVALFKRRTQVAPD